MAEGTIFLMYHELEEAGRSLRRSEPGYLRYVVRRADFQKQLELLQVQGWRGVSVGEGMKFAGGKTVAITFDDGSETDFLYAAPDLRRFGFGATFYVTNNWLGQAGHLSHGQLRELSALGFEIGCHSMSHAYLTDLDEEGLDREIVQAKSQLEQMIGAPVQHFSCPGGRFNLQVAQFARKAGYKTVATSRIHANSNSTDHFALGRAPVMRSTSLPQFEKLCRARGLWRSRMHSRLHENGKKILGNALYDRLRNALLRGNRH
jgi:peptidoglycan/xylan/chitin deacetylase (PgdA/CDA1 family)